MFCRVLGRQNVMVGYLSVIVKVKINFQIIHERPWALILNSLCFIGNGALRPQRRQEDETEAVSISNFVRL